MRQYHKVKSDYKDAILFFRMGDFYEMFYDDARTASRVLGITLTSRGHGKTGDVPLAGFPYHALDGYLAKMIRAGYRVAICEQVEDPKNAVGIVKRDVIQVVTPGTLIDETLLETNRNNYLAVLFQRDSHLGVASVDVSTGEFRVTESPASSFKEALDAVGPAEILLSEDQSEQLRKMLGQHKAVITVRDAWIFSRAYAREILLRHFKTDSLKGFGCEDLDAGLSAAGAALHYLQETQKADLSHLRRLSRYSDTDFMNLDAATRRNLEILETISNSGREGTLISILDHTSTPMGGRTLSAWLRRPLNRLEPITRRLNAVEELKISEQLRGGLQKTLRRLGDLERLITRVVTRRATPRDLKALGRFLLIVPEVKTALTDVCTGMLTEIAAGLSECGAAAERLEAALVDDPPAVLADGGIFRAGYNQELDELRSLTVSGKEWIARLQVQERERTGISSLKVGYNRVFGYYLEITKTHQHKVPENYIRKQTLVNSERYITPELKEEEDRILRADEKMADLERRLFEELRDYTATFAEAVQKNGRLLGELDCLLSLAAAADAYRYIKPDMRKKGADIIITDGRHPVVERLLPPGDPFIPNDVSLRSPAEQLLIITGPNMAGKSTFIRQVGLIVLMAQMGGFVPAASAEIGVVDRIFTRVGAQDNLAAGESTFLVEMNETANILNNATADSLILLDEIGRGTSTFDGLSIAWAVAEYLVSEPRVQAKTLFATHYHELTELALILPGVRNLNVAVKEWGDHIVFLRKIVPGGCDHSYGIQVARLAGLPAGVIARAKEVLHNLEDNELTPGREPKLARGKLRPLQAAEPQLNMFAARESLLRERIEGVDINTLTPLEALEFIDELKKSLQ